MVKPEAVITKLEDCPIWVDRELIKAYLNTDYFLESLSGPPAKSLLFRFDAPNSAVWRQLDAFKVERFAIITAFNPFSNPLSLKENLERNARLKIALQNHCRLMNASLAESPEGDWREPGFWALDISPETALRLGREFEQNAIVFWQKPEKAALWLLARP